MRKRKLFAFLTIISLILPLAGCFNKIHELTEEEETRVVRYMADAVLEHDVNYQARLLSEEEKQKALEEEARKEEELKKIVEQEKVEKEEKKAENTPDEVSTSYASKTYAVEDIDEYLGLENISFDFIDAEIAAQYPNNNSDVVVFKSPNTNNNLLLVKFHVNNHNDSDTEVVLYDKKVKYKAYINDDIKASNVEKIIVGKTLDEFNENIKAGEYVEADLVFEIPKDITVETLELGIRASGSDNIRIKLK